MVNQHEPWVGVLIDLDLALDINTTGKQPASSLHRTGTLPFMALDLLHDDDNYPQYHRHDLESFVYVLAWIAARYEDGSETNSMVFELWHHDNWSINLNDKFGFLHFSPSYDDFSLSTQYEFLEPVIESYRRLLGTAYADAKRTATKTGTPGTTTAQGRKRSECPDEGYVGGSSGLKRKRETESAKSGRFQSRLYPEELNGVNRSSMLSILTNTLNALDLPHDHIVEPVHGPIV